jgi:chemotaxis protein CheD
MNKVSNSAQGSPTPYFDRKFGIEAVKIQPGEYFATDKDIVLVTVLGSCVSACIRDTRTGVGGMNHFMLPRNGQETVGPVSMPARYGMYAMEVLINQLIKMGSRREHLEAKVFGGANVLHALIMNNIGEANADFVTEYLHNEGIRVTAKDMLGKYPRKVYFFPASGKVLVKKIRDIHNHTILERENEYSTRLRNLIVGGDAELFE